MKNLHKSKAVVGIKWSLQNVHDFNLSGLSYQFSIRAILIM